MPQILRLAAPSVTGLMAWTLAVIYDGWIIGGLGVEAFAGVALVLPLSMMMVQISRAAFGGALAGAVARALGRGDHAGAQARALHGVVLECLLGLLIAAVGLLGGSQLFALLGARGAVLTAAEAYALPVFAGCGITFFMNGLASVVSGSGNLRLPALCMIGITLLHLALCPLLVFGAAGWPGLGVAGAGWSLVLLNSLGALVLWRWLRRKDAPLRLVPGGFDPAAAREILRLGLTAGISPVISNGCVLVFAALAARFGTDVLAGYGIGARLEYIMVPIAFGFGAAIVPLVGRNIGAGQSARAERIAWIGAALVGTICASIGTLCALWPALWSGLYTSDAAAAAAAALYLQTVGPCYALLGFGLTFFMGCQGAGRLGWPLGGSVLRLCIAAGAGALVVASGQSNPQWLYLVVIASLLGYVGMMVAGTLRRPWAST